MTAITEYIEILLDGKDLSFEQAGELLDVIFEGDVPEVQIAAFLTAMRAKGVTAPELAGLAGSLRDHAVQVTGVDNLVDTCGTGGGKIKTCNISTAAAIVAAGAGVHVAKHGNRGITSKCGSADVLEALSVKIDASEDVVAQCIQQAGIGFMFAPMFHPAMKYVQPIRKSLGFRTVFNILGPLANPARAGAQVLGVASPELMGLVCEALKLLGTSRAMVVHSDGLDEISTVAPTKVLELKDGKTMQSQVDPKELGIPAASLDELSVSDAQASASVLREILASKDTGPRRDIVVLNAAAAVIVAGLADDFEAGMAKAQESIDSGKAADCLEKLVEVSNKA